MTVSHDILNVNDAEERFKNSLELCACSECGWMIWA